MYRLTAADLLVGCLEILQQNSPRNTIDEVVDENQQAACFFCPRLKATRRTGPLLGSNWLVVWLLLPQWLILLNLCSADKSTWVMAQPRRAS